MTQDDVEAVKWYRKAADQGHASGQLGLGQMYYFGEGVAKDKVEAYKWFLLAGAQGHELAEKSIAATEKTLTPGQRTEAQKRAREFKKK